MPLTSWLPATKAHVPNDVEIPARLPPCVDARLDLVNRHPRLLVTAVIDTSGSQNNYERPITTSCNAFPTSISEYLGRRVAELQLIQMTTQPRASEWRPVAEVSFPSDWRFGGMSPLGTSLILAVEQHQLRLGAYSEAGIPVQASLIILSSDGKPNHEAPTVTEQAIVALNEFERRLPTVHVFTATAALQDSDLEILKRISPRYPTLLLEEGWGALFTKLLPKLITSASSSLPHQAIRIDPIDGVREVVTPEK